MGPGEVSKFRRPPAINSFEYLHRPGATNKEMFYVLLDPLGRRGFPTFFEQIVGLGLAGALETRRSKNPGW